MTQAQPTELLVIWIILIFQQYFSFIIGVKWDYGENNFTNLDNIKWYWVCRDINWKFNLFLIVHWTQKPLTIHLMTGPIALSDYKYCQTCFSDHLIYVNLILFPFAVHIILIKPVWNNHLSCVTVFQCSLGKSHKTGLTIQHSFKLWFM